MKAIAINNISKEFKEGIRAKRVKALENLSLEIDKGEVFGFLGPNGAGKSTAIKTLLNLIYPDKGAVTIMGRDVEDKSVRQAVGYLPENPYYFDYLTADELLDFGGRTAGMGTHDIRSRKEELLDRLSLREARKRQLRAYSKGMLQRIGLAFALIHEPQIVILDEPMTGLDPIGRKMVGDMILDLKRAGKTVFFSSHILTDVERLCDRVGIIVGGRLGVVDTLGNLLAASLTLEDVFLREVKAAGGRIEE